MAGKIRLSSRLWSISGVKAIIFDKDGTLIDLHHYWAEVIRRRVEATICFYGLAQSHFFALCRSMGLEHETNRIVAEGPVGLAPRSEIILVFRQSLLNMGCAAKVEDLERIFDDVQEQYARELALSAKALPGAADFVRAAHRMDINLAIVTSDTASNAMLCLEAIGLADQFSSVVGRDRISAPKKSGEPARMALAEMGCDSSNTICIGDAPMDGAMSEASGCLAFVGVASGQIQEALLRELTPYTALSLSDIQVEGDL